MVHRERTRKGMNDQETMTIWLYGFYLNNGVWNAMLSGTPPKDKTDAYRYKFAVPKEVLLELQETVEPEDEA